MPGERRSGKAPSRQVPSSPLSEMVASASGSAETNVTALTHQKRQAIPPSEPVSVPVPTKEAVASGVAQAGISASQPAPAPMSGVVVSPAGQTGVGSSGTSRPAPHLPKNLKFKKKILMEASSNAAPSFLSSTPTMPTTSCKAESSSAGPSCRLHWTLEPELIQPASFLRQLGDASCINGDRLTKIYTRLKELCRGMYRVSEIHYKLVIDTFCPS